MNHKPLRVCYFGTYRADYARNHILITGLRRNGVEVIECQESLWHSIHIPPQMVTVPGGTFQMGDVEKLGESWRNPVHPVTIKPFAMGKYEVTFEEYDRFAIATGRRLPEDQGWGRGRRPVINVSWDDAKAYAEWLSHEIGTRYRLPTESEWEYAARSGGKDEIWSGTSDENQLKDYAVYKKDRTEPVGSKKPNRMDLYDMSGNVWEWVENCWHTDTDYVRVPTGGSPEYGASMGDCIQRVIRGGAWNEASTDIRGSFRAWNYPRDRDDFQGFRLAKDTS